MKTVTRSELELQALSQMDLNMIQLIDTAPLVGMYTFDTEHVEWKKAEREGVLFLYKRLDKNPYHMFILNREKDDHFFQPIINDLKLHVEQSYIMYRYKNTVYAIWFHQRDICVRIASCIQKMINGTYADKPLPEEKVDIIAMLQKAKQSSTEDEAIHSSTNPNSNVPPPGVLHFFMTASKTLMPQSFDPSQDPSMMKTLMDDPKYNLESIEKQQKLVLERK